MVFPMVMYVCESWTVKKAEHQRIDALELCWGRLLRVPWTARRSNKSILKEISPGCSLEGLMLKLKLQYFGHLMWRVDSSTRWTWVWVNSGGWWWTGSPSMLHFMGLQRVGHDWATELNRTELKHLDDEQGAPRKEDDTYMANSTLGLCKSWWSPVTSASGPQNLT